MLNPESVIVVIVVIVVLYKSASKIFIATCIIVCINGLLSSMGTNY